MEHMKWAAKWQRYVALCGLTASMAAGQHLLAADLPSQLVADASLPPAPASAEDNSGVVQPLTSQTAAPVPVFDASYLPPTPLLADEISYADPAGAPKPAAPAPKPAAPKKKAPPVFPPPKVLNQPGPWKPVYYDNDFSFKKDPKHEHVFGEELKDIQGELFGEKLVFSTGGELRHRYMFDDNRLRPGPAQQNNFNQWRWRHYADLKIGDVIRGYVEGIDASTFGNRSPDQAIDVDRWDLLNAFVDVKVFELDGKPQYLRYGRQELIYGRQRLISPLDWANTRRTFEGFKYMHRQGDWKVDVFSVRPVSASTGFNTVARNDNAFDQPNYHVLFSGAYASYGGWENTNLDLYYLWLHDSKPRVGFADGDRHSTGARYTRLFPVTDGCGKDDRVWDIDIEGAYQFGRDNNQEVQAGFATFITGHTWKKIPWSPRLSGGYYLATGDRTPTDGMNNTFFTYFPLGHAYWGISDNLSGQNLRNYSAQFDVKPTKKLTAATAYNIFELASGGDRLYNVAQAPVGAAGIGRGGVGQSWDVYGTYNFNVNFDVQVGYSKFFYGSFLNQPALSRGDAEQFYVQTSLRY
jgi:Alginate export